MPSPPIIPRHDPVPVNPPAHVPSLAQRFWRIFRLLSLFALVVAAIAVTIVARAEPAFHLHMLVATALGTGFTVLVGASLMSLVFLSSSSGHDDDAAAPPPAQGSDIQ